jgi:hypothetical protein
MIGAANISPFVGGSAVRPLVGGKQLQHTIRGDYFAASAVVAVMTGILSSLNHAVLHWFLVPVMACGVLAGVDIVRLARERLDLFDPRTIIACLAFYGFFIAPILHVVWNQYGVGNEMFLFGDWRNWLAGMGALNAAGLIMYRVAQNAVFQRARPSATLWEIQNKRFYPLSLLALALSVAGVCAFFWQFDGIEGLVNTFERNQQAFAGKGWLLVFAWPLAVLSFVILVHVGIDQRRKLRHPLTLGVVLASLFGVGHFILMGWYGSRSATVWALFWMLGIVHYNLIRLSRKIMMLGVTSLVVFMYFYGFYKERGRAGLEVLRTPAMWLQPAGYERDLKYLLTGDLARADSNALILHNLVKDPGDYDYRWGLTYVGALAIVVPRNIWANRPEIRVDAGTEAQIGKTAPWPSSRLYGLSGEALLNFGPAGVPLLFLIYGSMLGWYRRKLGSWERRDARMLLAPFFTLMAVGALVYDSDVIVFFALSEGLLVSTLIFTTSRRLPAKQWINPCESTAHS